MPCIMHVTEQKSKACKEDRKGKHDLGIQMNQPVHAGVDKGSALEAVLYSGIPMNGFRT